MNPIFFSSVDGKFLSLMRDFILEDRVKPPQGRGDASYVFITGGAGTGKTMIQDGIRYLKDIRPVFSGSTNIAGMEQNKVFTLHQMFVNDFTVYFTTFRQMFRINPPTWAKCLKILFENLPQEVIAGQMRTPRAFWDAIWPNLMRVCAYLIRRATADKDPFLSVEEYHKYRKIVLETNKELKSKLRRLRRKYGTMSLDEEEEEENGGGYDSDDCYVSDGEQDGDGWAVGRSMSAGTDHENIMSASDPERPAPSVEEMYPTNLPSYGTPDHVDREKLEYDRLVHMATMEHILSVCNRNSIFDQLLYDTFVIDESGRLPCTWILVKIGMFYYIHNLFKTGVTKPTFVLVGSCTQSTVINDACMDACGRENCGHPKVPLNDYSCITMLVKKCIIYSDSVMVRNNKHNRRIKSGDPERTANLALFMNCLEMGEPIPEEVMRYIREHMTVTKEQFYSTKCIHLCNTHEDCEKVLAADVVAPNDIIRIEESMVAKTTVEKIDRGEDGPQVLYHCTRPAGAMYRSVNYPEKRFIKTVLDEPLGLGTKYIYGLLGNDESRDSSAGQTSYLSNPYGLDDSDSDERASTSGSLDSNADGPPTHKKCKKSRKSTGMCSQQSTASESDSAHPPKFVCWSNTRFFYKYRPYMVTHSARGSLVSISGSWENFLKDLSDMEPVYEENPVFIRQLVMAMVNSLRYSFVADPDYLEDIQDKMQNGDDMDDLLHCLYDLRCIMSNAVNARKDKRAQRQKQLVDGTADDGGIPKEGVGSPEEVADIVYSCRSNERAKLTIPKGTTVYLEGKIGAGPRSGVLVRFGKTLVVAIYHACIRVDQPLSAYSSDPDDIVKQKRGREQAINRKRAANDSAVVNNGVGDACTMQAPADPTCDFSDDEDAHSTSSSVVSAITDINTSESAAASTVPTLSVDDFGGKKFKSDFTVLEIIPLKLSMVSTVAASQGMTINSTVYGQINKTISAYNLIVMATRSSSSDDLFFYIADPDMNFTIEPLDDITAETIKLLFTLSLQTTGMI
ncbi:hypothetical protein RRG08_010272 [Elysia crispata]|uniref:Uncharacterized protein n=1 Tax=Elysia crispata TaxID=231223 RepID=A0AAE1D9P6_9GAST|nr:hypothetical protein RRG08_010272 [Elysia crispata]